MFGVGGLDVAADAAEEVQFPRGVQAGLEQVRRRGRAPSGLLRV